MTPPSPQIIEAIAAVLFAIAIAHTFATKFFEHLAHVYPRHAGIWHLLGEVEIVFGFWAMVLMVAMFALNGKEEATDYLDSRNFTEPMFVFAIMVIAASRPILEFASALVRGIVHYLPLARPMASYFVVLAFVPLLGSFITEPAAMTLAALMIRDTTFAQPTSTRFRYATLGVLFVNISIGGTLTPFAAPPVLMVAATWQWDMAFMLANFGWKAALAVLINAGAATMLFRRELLAARPEPDRKTDKVPAAMVVIHLALLTGVVAFAHHPQVFIALFLFFMGFVTAYPRHQHRLILREGLLVAFFLAGLIVLGGLQRWWLQPLLMGMDENMVFFGATALTAFTDNAALTYLGSLVEGLSEEFKIALVAGAVTGGGLTIIANAPNPAGVAILREKFSEGAIHPLGLLLGALGPTLTSIVVFRLL